MIQEYELNGPKSFYFPYPVRYPAQISVQVSPGEILPPSAYQVIGYGPTSTGVTIYYPDAPVEEGLKLVITRYTSPNRVSIFEDDIGATAAALNAEFDNIYDSLQDYNDIVGTIVGDLTGKEYMVLSNDGLTAYWTPIGNLEELTSLAEYAEQIRDEIEAMSPENYVQGPASATDGAIAAFDGTTGKLIKNTTTAATAVVTGPASVVGDTIAIFDGTTGKKIKSSGITTSGLTVGDGTITTAKLANNAVTSEKIADGAITFGKLGNYTPGSIIVYKVEGERTVTGTTPKKVKEITLAHGGKIKVSFTLHSNDAYTAYGQIHRNGLVVGSAQFVNNNTTYQTFAEDTDGWSKGDVLQLWLWGNHASAIAYTNLLQISASEIYNDYGYNITII